MHFVALSSAHAQTTVFFERVKTGTPQDVQKAISNGADINARNEYYGETPLIYAAQYNSNPAVITTLLKAGADIEARTTAEGFPASLGWTALLWAAGYNRPEVITVLLKAGADINVRGKAGTTVLMAAARYNSQPEVMTTLLKAGADAKAKDNIGQTAFDWAQGNATLKGTDAYRMLQQAS